MDTYGTVDCANDKCPERIVLYARAIVDKKVKCHGCGQTTAVHKSILFVVEVLEERVERLEAHLGLAKYNVSDPMIYDAVPELMQGKVPTMPPAIDLFADVLPSPRITTLPDLF